jgi:hypothetical protein
MKIKERMGMPAMAAVLLVALLLGALVFATISSAEEDGIQRGIEADAARYTALGNYYQEDGIQRGIESDAARYTALGRYYADQFGSATLAANPELMIARRYISTAALTAGDSLLAANPELMAARRYISTAALAASDARLAANPELISLTRYDTCGC